MKILPFVRNKPEPAPVEPSKCDTPDRGGPALTIRLDADKILTALAKLRKDRS